MQATRRSSSKSHTRRFSKGILGEFTQLPALASLDPILHSDGPTVQEHESQIQQTMKELEATGSPSQRPQLTDNSGRTRSWNLHILGRTFKEHPEEEVIDSVAEVLQLDWDDAASRVAKAKGQMLHVLYTCSERKVAFQMMDALRSKGLLVQVTSDQSNGVDSLAGVAGAATVHRRICRLSRAKTTDASFVSKASSSSSTAYNSASTSSGSTNASLEHSATSVSPKTGELRHLRSLSKDFSSADEAMLRQVSKESTGHGATSDEFTEGHRKAKSPRAQRHSLLVNRQHTTSALSAKDRKEERAEHNPEPKIQQRSPRALDPQPPTIAPTAVQVQRDTVVDRLACNNQPASPARRDLCDIARFWFFGVHWALGQDEKGNQKPLAELEATYRERIGTKDDVKSLFSVFKIFDTDGNGRIDVAEFRDRGWKLMKRRFVELSKAIKEAKRKHAETVVLRDVRRHSICGTGDPALDRTQDIPTMRQLLSGRRNQIAAGESAVIPSPRDGTARSPRRNITTALESSPSEPPGGVCPARRNSWNPGDPASNKETHTRSARRTTTAGVPKREEDFAACAVARHVCTGLGFSLPPWVQDAEDYDNLEELLSKVFEKVVAHILRKKTSCSIEDWMRTIWINTTASDVKIMKTWIHELFEEDRAARIKTPPPLSADGLEDLEKVFEHYDDERKGELSFGQLVLQGVMDRDKAETLREEWDCNWMITKAMFCEMMCPVGYRATKNSTVGTLKDGSRIKLDKEVNYWRLDDVVCFSRSSTP